MCATTRKELWIHRRLYLHGCGGGGGGLLQISILIVMAYRRRQGSVNDSTSAIPNLNSRWPDDSPEDISSSSSAPQSLAAKAIRASSAYRDSSLSSAYGESALSPRQAKPIPVRSSYTSSAKDDSTRYDNPSTKNLDEPKRGFWGALARKARAIIDDDVVQQYETPERRRQQLSDMEAKSQLPENRRKADNPALQKGLDAITSSFNYIGNALEEGMTVVENRTAEIIQETRKLHSKKKSEEIPASTVRKIPQMKTDTEIQLKASRDVSMAMAAKAKVLLRELKTVKADLAFAKERCAQLEDENKILRETRGGSDRPEDDDLIRLQLESLLAEKARLAQENSVYARENRFLREIVEYHQLTMQDVVYIDENREEVSEVYPVNNLLTTNNNNNLLSPVPHNTNPHVIGDITSPPFTPKSPFALNADDPTYKM
ncbi:hypothetical protein L1987_20537 [Smallanthus sonchifolius]|uniref:Uncharacterized protein n=1 Tax=Smallanthus sonchifolius TaxID=185202 RepID=A0ACB9IS92_9ASTR|nr:hypothetical protein L1987_20537 [Smallanthus sonchifolius]